MGIFSKINEAKGTEGGLYFEPGNYVVRVNRCKMVESFKGSSMFCIETTLIESDHETLRVGMDPAHLVKMGGEFPDLALGNVADFCRAALASLADQKGLQRPKDINEIPLDEETVDEITGENNLVAGVFLTVKAFNKPTKQGKDFTRLKWGVPANLSQLVANAA